MPRTITRLRRRRRARFGGGERFGVARLARKLRNRGPRASSDAQGGKRRGLREARSILEKYYVAFRHAPYFVISLSSRV